MKYSEYIDNPTRFRALSGLNPDEFLALLPLFSTELANYLERKTFNNQTRLNKYSQRKKDILPTDEDKFFFILVYLKNNPTQEYHAAFFNLTQDMCNKWIHLLLDLTKKLLKKYIPKDKIPDNLDQKEFYIIDATERKVQRDTYNQKEYYSGKKKTHTIKNLVIIAVTGIVIFASKTIKGSVHDKKIADDEIGLCSLNLMGDLGFYGLDKIWENLFLPYKKPKNEELTSNQKKFNQGLSKERVKIENTFAEIKRFRILKDVCRSTKEGVKDSVFQIACGLHNFRVRRKLDFAKT